MSKKKRLKTDEAEEWFWWSIEGRGPKYVANYGIYSSYKLCPHVGRQSTDGKLTSILEVRRLHFIGGGYDTTAITAIGELEYLLSRSPVVPTRQRDEVPIEYMDHPDVYQGIRVTLYEPAETPHLYDYCVGGHTGLLIWNPNIWSHMCTWNTYTFGKYPTWMFRMWCRIRMVSSEVYASNQLGHATTRTRHIEDKPEAEHIQDTMAEVSWPRAAAEFAYQTAGDYVTEAASSVLEYVTPVAIGAVTAYAQEVIAEHLQ